MSEALAKQITEIISRNLFDSDPEYTADCANCAREILALIQTPGTRYYSLNSGKTTYTCLSIDEAEDMQARLGGSISHQFTNEG